MAQRMGLTRLRTAQRRLMPLNTVSFQPFSASPTLLGRRHLTNTRRTDRSLAVFTREMKQLRLFSAEKVAAKEEKPPEKDTPPEAAAEKPKEEDEDECPVWQNPLHHNNPELEKCYPEDFAEGEEMPIVPLPPLDGSPPPHVLELADEILNLRMLEMNELVNKIADHFGFDDVDIGSTIGVGGGGGAAAEGGGEAAEEEKEVEAKTSFDLKLTGFDAKSKIKVIKEVRAIAELGLKEAKELVEGAPKVIKKDLKQEDADELKAKLEAVGATVEIV